MLWEWEHFKLVGPWEIENSGLAWCIFAKRSDGAVFWQNLSVWPHQDFWERAAQAFSHLDTFLHVEAPVSSYVAFANVGIDENRKFR